jgi:hypothetical protein
MKMNADIYFPYKSDIKLLNKLGLPIWEAKLNEELYLGEVFPYKKENGHSISIKIWVTCTPAQFYRFIIKNTDEDISLEIETGSGSLIKYYPMVLSIAQGNLVIKPFYS